MPICGVSCHLFKFFFGSAPSSGEVWCLRNNLLWVFRAIHVSFCVLISSNVMFILTPFYALVIKWRLLRGKQQCSKNSVISYCLFSSHFTHIRKFHMWLSSNCSRRQADVALLPQYENCDAIFFPLKQWRVRLFLKKILDHRLLAFSNMACSRLAAWSQKKSIQRSYGNFQRCDSATEPSAIQTFICLARGPQSHF